MGYGFKKIGGKWVAPPHYYRWKQMKYRCSSKKSPEFIRYGGRGIYVCEEWKDFLVFQKWCFETFEEGKTIDRIDNNGPYSPENCRWATPLEQQLNSRITPQRLAGIKKAKAAQVTKLHNDYGDPKTRTHIMCCGCKKYLEVSFFKFRGGSRKFERRTRCKECEIIWHREYWEKKKNDSSERKMG